MNETLGRLAAARAVGRALLAVFIALLARPAAAQDCESARPTSAAGAAGLSYGSATVDFFDSPSGRARIHYALSGTHRPSGTSTRGDGVPDAVAVAAQAADDALDRFAELGFEAPISDRGSPCDDDGGSDAVDVYLIHFAAADGQAVLDHCQAGAPRRCAGFVLVENDFRAAGYADAAAGMRTVVPHELFHLVQHAYDAGVERWWAEGSAQWAAKQVYPELTDLERFLPSYFESPWRPLNVPPNGVITSFLYATAIWPVFLHERFDAALVREIFAGLDGSATSVLPTTDVALRGRNSTLAEQFLWFAAYNAATGARAPSSGGYQNAGSYPEVELIPFDAAVGSTLDEVGSGLGAFYYSVTSGKPVELSLDADTARFRGLLVPVREGRAELDGASQLPARLEGDAIVVVAGQSLSRVDAAFTLRASVAGAAGQAGEAGPPNGSADAPHSSSCSMSAARPGPLEASAWLGFVISCCRGWRARRTRKDVLRCARS